MNIAIYIADLTKTNQHLMPWRTILEVLHEAQICGHKTLLLSGQNNTNNISVSTTYNNIETVRAPKPFSTANRAILAKLLTERQIDTLYFPIAFSRDYRPLQELEKQSSCHLVWYVPGGWFTPKQTLKAIKYLGLKPVLPYLLQAFMPKRYFIKKLTSIGERAIVTMSKYTGEQLQANGYKGDLIFAAPPGKSPIKKATEQGITFAEYSDLLTTTKYFLFFGPPNPIRGVPQIIKAFSNLSRLRKDVKLVCLFRGDANINPTLVQNLITAANLGDQIICLWSSVNGTDLDLFIKHCFAVLKPFLIVPSEIPLAVLETAGYSKPVIGTGPDGTGAFIDNFGLTVPHADSGALTNAMLHLLDDSDLYEQKCLKAKELYIHHPDWCAVSKIWLQAGEMKTA